ncbi:hypothetical protein KP001_21775 [Geomonas subterranea]|uniref:Uncharacterized protein n=1 Tax=Geomonas subterranea TaxID=2847989 RepID=A0ABX8LG59_9BACT|nr:hypothetical protein [Geomonas subterranea]QXE90967.1 hypothetical protein KP001_21775 [Geomonas subterranea]QXM10946.1 hypothetical protein KP002_07495 [Geomonas subterranea]
MGVRDFGQSVGGTYSLQHSKDSAAANSTVMEQNYTEDYGVQFDYFVVTPLLWKGRALLDLEGVQKKEEADGGTARSSQVRLRYNLNAYLLPSTPYPVSIAASSARETVSLPFSPDYQSEHDDLMTILTIQNQFVPSELSLAQQSQTTSGQGRDITQKSHSFNLNTRPNLGALGMITASINLSESDSSGIGSDSSSHNSSGTANFGYHNSWRSAQNLARNFSLTYGYHQNAGTSVITTQTLNSGVGWEFGKVLQGDLTYFSSKSSSFEQKSQSQGVSGALSHKLMGSLRSAINASATRDQYDDGQNTFISAGLNLGYHKRLPAASDTTVGYGYTMTRNEHTGGVSSIFISEERHPVPIVTPGRIRLNQPTFQANSITVVGAQSRLPYPASFYNIVPEGIELTDHNLVDTDILISYRYTQDPNIVTVGTNHGANAAVNLFAGKYRVYTNANQSDQRLVKGQATSLTTSGTRHFDLGATANLTPHNLSAELGYDKDYAQNQYYLTGSWGTSAPYAGGDVSVNANDRFTLQRSNGRDDQYWANSLSLQSTYRRNFGRIAGKFKANYANMASADSTFHTASLGANLEASFGKLFVLLNSSVLWTFSAGGNTSSETISLSFRRSF